jgi:hypothetical protein
LLPEIGSYMGSTASLRYFFKEHTGLRCGISLYGYREKNKWESRTMTSDSLLYSNSQDYSDLSIQLSIQYISFLKSFHYISLYWGIGPIFGIANGNTINRNYQAAGENSTVNRTYSLGISGSLGAEWIITEDISLSAEYNSELKYSWYKNENKIDPSYNIYTSQGSKHKYSSEKILGSSNIRLGITLSV